MEISFIRKPSAHGKRKLKKTDEYETMYVLTIPQNYIRTGIIDPDLKYKVKLSIYEEVAQKNKYLKIIEGLDQQLAFGKLDKETYFKLVKKYEEKLI